MTMNANAKTIAWLEAAIAEWVDLAFKNTEPKRIARCLGRAKAAENRLNKLLAKTSP